MIGSTRIEGQGGMDDDDGDCALYLSDQFTYLLTSVLTKLSEVVGRREKKKGTPNLIQGLVS